MLYFILAAAIVLLDQYFKYWIVEHIELYGTMELLPGFMRLTYIQNTGAAFSFFSGMRWVLLAVSVVCSVLIIVALLKMKTGFWGRLSLSFVLGGAVGNGIDRACFGYVVDMFETEFMDFAVFNVADCFIVVGGIMFCICFIIETLRDERAAKLAAKAGTVPEAEKDKLETDDDAAEEKKDEPEAEGENGK